MGRRDDAPTPAADFREQGRGGIWVCKRVGGGFSIQEAGGRGGGGQEGAEPAAAAAAAAAAAGIDSIVLLPLRGVFAFLLLFWLVVMRLRLLHVRLSVLAVCCACEGAD
jgi:hypothetical protein